MSDAHRTRVERWVLYLVAVQVLAGALMAISGAWASQSLGPFAGAALTLLLWVAMKKGGLAIRPALVLALGCTVLGLLLVFPKPL